MLNSRYRHYHYLIHDTDINLDGNYHHRKGGRLEVSPFSIITTGAAASSSTKDTFSQLWTCCPPSFFALVNRIP